MIMIPFSIQVITEIILHTSERLIIIFVIGAVGSLHISVPLNPLLISTYSVIVQADFHKLQDSFESWWSSSP